MKPTEIGATFQIPKFEAHAELRLSDNRHLSGKLFLSILPASPLGHASVLDWFNEPSQFFPFMPANSTEAEILNKQLLVEATVNAQLNQEELANIAQTVWIEQIEVHCDPFLTLSGSIVLNMPPDRSRVLDFLNQPTQFFSLRKDDNSHIINKRYITNVKELSSLPPLPPTKVETSNAKRSSRRTIKK